jgi:hypothetical protein
MNRIGDSLHHTASNANLVRAFAARRVEFVIVGGLAVAWYCAHRAADDMDILINPTRENSARVSHALSDLQFLGFTENTFARPSLKVPLKQQLYADLLTPRPDGPTFSEVAGDAVDAKIYGLSIKVASPAALIRMKKQAIASADMQNEKHREDIELLRPLMG